VAVHLGSLLWPKPPQFSGGSLLWPKPLQFSGGSLLGPKPVAVLRWVLFQAEACPIVPWIVASTEVSATFRWIAVRTEILPVLLRKDVLAEASSSLLLDSRRDRSLWQVSRIPAWAEALAVHRSVFRFRPKPWRFTCPENPFRPKPIGIFRPESMSAGTGILPGRLPIKAEALAVRLRSAVPAEADRFLRFWIPFEAEALPVLLWRFREAEASGSTGLLDETCRSLQKLRGKPVASAWRRLRQPPSP
jgi:hypothetical protein